MEGRLPRCGKGDLMGSEVNLETVKELLNEERGIWKQRK